MLVNKVKKIIREWPGVEIQSVKARTVAFTDLARCRKVFLEVTFAKEPDWGIYKEMKLFCVDAGMILSNNQMWVVEDKD